tara:strand:+ start:171 stop:1328 length:1158 start_codon:yes stop_codon:yes gene_type:complete
MRILVLGGDGYLGWPTSMHLASLGHKVAIVDNMSKRVWEAECSVEPLFPISTISTRVSTFEKLTNFKIDTYIGDISRNHRFVYRVFEEFLPDAIIHYAEQPSAPYSMKSRETCVETQRNNVLGNLNIMFAMAKYTPEAHLIKLGTMGEYGTPNIDIEEGWLEITHNGRKDKVLYPKKPHSFYHLSKVHDSHNLEFGCRVWGLKVTDLNQGVVYGNSTKCTDLDVNLETSFHYDHVFGTVLNRFLVQSVANIPLTIYGEGTQTRPALNINDTIRCVEIAASNPAEKGEFRVFNQFTESFKINDLASMVKEVGDEEGLNVKIQNIENPRTEKMSHYYNAKNTNLRDLGLDPIFLSKNVLRDMLLKVIKYKDRIDLKTIMPDIKWSKQ